MSLLEGTVSIHLLFSLTYRKTSYSGQTSP